MFYFRVIKKEEERTDFRFLEKILHFRDCGSQDPRKKTGHDYFSIGVLKRQRKKIESRVQLSLHYYYCCPQYLVICWMSPCVAAVCESKLYPNYIYVKRASWNASNPPFRPPPPLAHMHSTALYIRRKIPSVKALSHLSPSPRHNNTTYCLTGLNRGGRGKHVISTELSSEKILWRRKH